jgi:hypothetical protein
MPKVRWILFNLDLIFNQPVNERAERRKRISSLDSHQMEVLFAVWSIDLSRVQWNKHVVSSPMPSDR